MSRVARIAAIIQGDISLVTCDSCGAEASASVEKVSGCDRIVYTCPECRTSWAQTEYR